ncbi:MAG: hypothetical protein JO228_03110 [Xanthobacteraceae bacterium]|nr:hypothetical protein [Xanthobacteraceae bacterium]
MKFAVLASLIALAAGPALGAEIAHPNDTARLLAGLPVAADSALASLASEAAWQAHAARFNSMFGEEDRSHLSHVRAFAKERLSPTHDTLFYFFSGPDALHAVALFPNANTYVMAGLEPPGNIPPLETLSKATLGRTERGLEVALGNLMKLSYFITKNMANQLRPGPVYGTLPVIYVFLARSGATIEETTFVGIDGAGNEVPADPNQKSAAKGVKITFTLDGGPKKTLYYFSTDLANGGVKNSGFLAFCEKQGAGGADAFVKSASYLLHGGSFSTVRNFLLDHTASILQDDTGIPVSFFDRAKWQPQPFGHYTRPIAVFSHNYQPKLAELYTKGNPIPIDFGLGYRWRINQSSLLLVQRKTAEPKAN